MSSRRAQRGIVLLVFAAIFLLGFSSALIYALGKWRDPVTGTRNHNAEVLQQAKTALIGYVAKEVLDLRNNDVPGLLPCPETLGSPGTANEGVIGSSCKPTNVAAKTIGRLPWRTLGLDKLLDASGEPLWYAVSPNWAFDGATYPVINSGTIGQLSVDSTNDVVAAIIAPGAPLIVNPNANQLAAGCVARTQSRIADQAHNTSSTTNLDYRDYLECQASSLLTFQSAVVDNATNSVSNDQIVFITSKDILNAIQGPLSERMQRTVAPLLSEFGDQWVAAGSKFLPYAAAFKPPEFNLAATDHCGPTAAPQATEGLLPIAPNSGACSSDWAGSFSGDGITSLGCSGTPTTCSFRYYRFTFLGQLLLGLTGANSISATLQATAPHAAASFRISPVQNVGDIAVTSGSASLGGFVKPAPTTTGDVTMSVQATVASTNICKDSLLGGLLCGTLGGLFVTTQTVSLQFAQLTTPILSGTKLSAAVKNGGASFNLLSPAAGDPHYWFMRNEWYRYTYYAVASKDSAAASGSNLTVSGFPAANGNDNDKHFVLALMGPAVTGQARGTAAAFTQYVEGQNAVTTGSPRTFAYQVYASSGNDRLATCPFTDGTTPCD